VLANLPLEDRTRLLRLLLAREQIEAEQAPDTRPSIAEIFDAVRDEYAAKSGDPSAYVEADRAHTAAIQRISARRSKERPRTETAPTLDALWCEFLEVTQLARDAGAPPPDELIKRPPPTKPEADSLEKTARRKSLPRSVRDDIEWTEAHHREETAFRRAAEEDEADRLRPWRDKSPSSMPPSYPDS
jgi:hypothetical protein